MSSLKVNSATPEDFARIFLAVWNSRNAAAMQAMYTPDGVMYDPWAPQGISGDAITAATQRVLDRYPDMLFTLISAVGNESSVAFDWRLKGLFATADGRRTPIEVTGCDVCRLRDGKIVELRGYFDRADILKLMNAKVPA